METASELMEKKIKVNDEGFGKKEVDWEEDEG